MSEESKPCPFCGSDDIHTKYDDGIHWEQCEECGSTGHINSRYSGEEDQEFVSWKAPQENNQA